MVRLRPWSVLVAFAVTVAFAGWFAYPISFSVLAPHDDEGYMLIALKGFRDGLPLYDDVYGQYGPAFFVILSALFTLFGLPVSHDAARFVTLGLWITSSVLCGAVAYRFSRSLTLGCAVVLLVFWRLLGFVGQPLHPGCVLVVLLAAMVATAVYILPRLPRIGLLVIGAAAATATLVKINVGGFAILSVIFAWSVAVRPFPGRRLVRLAATGLLVATPFALMAPDLGETWAQRYALLVALAAVALGLAPLPPGHRAPRELAWIVVGALGAGVAFVAAVLLRGTTPGSLLDAVFVQPLGQRLVFMVPHHVPAWTAPLAVLSIAGALASRSAAGRGGESAWSSVTSVLRVAAGLALLTTPVGLVLSPQSLGFALLPLAWIAACPPDSGQATDLAFARVLLAALAVLQALHAYPVSGAQVDWASFLLIPAGALCLSDGLRQMTDRAHAATPMTCAVTRGIAVALPAILLGAIVLRLVNVGASFWTSYQATPPLGLPGAARVHPDRKQAEALRWLAAQLHGSCYAFVSLPGINSLYLLAEMAPPTALNTNSWMYLLDANTQARIVARLDQIDRLCLVENPALLGFFTRGRPIPQRPLAQYLEHGFEVLGTRNGWVVKVRRSRPPASSG